PRALAPVGAGTAIISRTWPPTRPSAPVLHRRDQSCRRIPGRQTLSGGARVDCGLALDWGKREDPLSQRPCDNCTLHLVTSLPWAASKVPLDMASLAIVRPAPRPKAGDCACLRPLDTDKNPTRTLSGCRNGVYCERGCVRYSLCDSRPLP